MAKIDTQNVGSMRTIAKISAREGEKLERSYALARDKGPDGHIAEEKKRDVICWYVNRP